MKKVKTNSFTKGMAAAGFLLAAGSGFAKSDMIMAEETDTTPAVIEEADKDTKELTNDEVVFEEDEKDKETEETTVIETAETEDVVESETAVETENAETVDETVEEEIETTVETADTVEASESVSQTENSITFSEDGIVSTYEEGVTIDGTALTITASGSYTVTGTCSQGSITVAKGLQEVILTLQNLTLSNSETAPITIGKNSEATIINEGTTTITDAEDIANEDSDDFEGAAIKVKSGATLTLDGTGTLNIDGSDCKNGIKGASGSTIIVDSADLTLNVFAANNGIASDNEVIINNGIVNVSAGNDGIKAEPDEDDADSTGVITINDGIITIDAQGDGIQATGDVTIYDGTFVITTYDGYTNIDYLDEDSSAKGIKSDANILIYGGDYIIDACEDAIHADGNITITDGTFDIYAGDDAIHADYVLTLGDDENGPTVNIYSAVEGLEGASVYIKNGSYDIVTSDDGINAANSDLTDYAYVIDISGGDIHVNAEGDGLDSNGSIYISDGTVVVYGAKQGENSAVDYGDNPTDEFVISGGMVLLVGQNQMALTPTSGNYAAFGYNAGMPMNPNGQMPQDGITPPEMPQNGQMPDFNSDMPMNPNGQMPQDGTMPPEMPQNGQMPDFNNGMPIDPDSRMPSEMTNMGFMAFDSTFENANMMQMNVNGVQINAGDLVSIVDENGNTVYSFTAEKSANCVLYASESLTGGEYSLMINNTEAASSTKEQTMPQMPETDKNVPINQETPTTNQNQPAQDPGMPADKQDVIENASANVSDTKDSDTLIEHADAKIETSENDIVDQTLDDLLNSDMEKTLKNKRSSSSHSGKSSSSKKSSMSSNKPSSKSSKGSSKPSKDSSNSSKSVNTAVDVSSASSIAGMSGSILGLGFLARLKRRKNNDQPE
ncbi:MAG: carbohydrate-binding domain-containing protein [Faecalicoccus sp.]|nr:carbohydrate-binding domain-containing protein [Faecalicoccus sp.]